MSRGVGVIMSKYEWGNVESVVAYHERERLCPEGVRVREIAHVHYGTYLRVKSTAGGYARISHM